MNNRKILLILCGFLIPLQLLCMDVINPADIQNRLNRYDRDVRVLQDQIRAYKLDRRDCWNHVSKIISDASFITMVCTKLVCQIGKISAPLPAPKKGGWFSFFSAKKTASIPIPQGNSLVQLCRNMSWPQWVLVSCVASSIIYLAFRTLQYSSIGKRIGKFFLPRIAGLKNELRTTERERNQFFEQLNRQHQNERNQREGVEGRAAMAEAQLGLVQANFQAVQRQNQARQNEIVQLRQQEERVRRELGTAQANLLAARQQNQARQEDIERLQREFQTVQTRHNRLQQILNQIQQNHPEAIPHEHCAICDEDVDDVVQLACRHSFCGPCLARLLQIGFQDNSTRTLRCPNPQCPAEFSQVDIENIIGPEGNLRDALDRYNQIKDNEYLAGLGQDVRQCPTSNCPSIWIFEHVEGQPDAKAFTCPGCNQTCCANCLVDWNIHERRTCPEAQAERDRLAAMAPEQRAAIINERQFQQYLAENDGIICPRCQRPLQRCAGCDHMVCGRDTHSQGKLNGCGYDFCFRCLLPWQAHQVDPDRVDFFNGSTCDNALQYCERTRNRWALELQRWHNQAHRAIAGDANGNGGGRAHFLEICQQLGPGGAHQLFA